MDNAKSFMNWGFNPKMMGEGKSSKPFLYVYGGGNDDGESYCGVSAKPTLKEALLLLWEMWDNQSYKLDEPDEYALLDEDENGNPIYTTLTLTDYNGDVNCYLNNVYYINGEKFYILKTGSDIYGPDTILIGELTELDEPTQEEIDDGSYAEERKARYESYIENNKRINDYIKAFEEIPNKNLMTNTYYQRPNQPFHYQFAFVEVQTAEEYQAFTRKILYQP
tara:strand:+ start:62 stop:727 length:666 start_codon:yes stop_codon:yes gene_type:complete